MAINGRGFFEILQPNGISSGILPKMENLYLSADGEIVNADGLLLQPSISIPEGAQSITIGQDGTVSVLLPGDVSPTEVGSVQLTDFINPAGLRCRCKFVFRDSCKWPSSTGNA